MAMLVAMTIAGLAAHGGDQAKLPLTVAKETTVIVSPLQEDGSPDYVAAMNERYAKGVKVEENGYVPFAKMAQRKATEKWRTEMVRWFGEEFEDGEEKEWESYVSFLKAKSQDTVIQIFIRDLGAMCGQWWDEEDSPELAAYLKRSERFLDAAKQAVERPKFFSPLVLEDHQTMLDLSDPGQSAATDVASALAARATLRAKQDDFAGFLSDVIAIKRLARLLSKAGTLWGWNAAVWVEERGNRTIGTVAGSGKLTVEQCVELEKALDGLEAMAAGGGVAEKLDVHYRWRTLDAAVVIATKRETFQIGLGGRNWELLDRDTVDWDVVLQTINLYMDDCVAAARKETYTEALKAWNATEEKWGKDGDLNINVLVQDDEDRAAHSRRLGKIIGWGLWYMKWADDSGREQAMRSEMVRVVLAVARYRAEHGRWPRDLETLVPVYLKEVPRDIYSEGGKAAVGYSWADDGISVTAIGAQKNTGERTAVEVGK